MSDSEELTDLEKLKKKHRNEQKDLRSKIQSLKKSATKGDKKKKKEIQDEIEKLEKDLEEKHKQELIELETSKQEPMKELEEEVGKIEIDNNEKKPNKQKLRKQKKLEKMEEIRRQALEEAKNGINKKDLEEKSFENILNPKNLSIKEIAPDGHCLYNALADQLIYKKGKTINYKLLRKMAADYMRENRIDFEPFLEEDFESYCNQIEHSAEWGGQLEIQAISQSLKIPIHIFQANSEKIIIGQEFEEDPLLISYHKFSYGLGEHYNSLREKE